MNNLYNDFTEKILALPMWVKEIVYFILKQNLRNTLPESDIETKEEDLYQYSCPQITYAGKKEYERLKLEEPNSDEFKFFEGVTNHLCVAEITLNNAWTLEETSQIYHASIENQFISKPENPVVFAKIAYFAGKIRIGEYLKRIGLINVDQLETAMRIQKENEMANVKKGFASILVDLNLVTRNDTDKILLLKQESKRRFVLNFNNNENEPAFLSKENQNLQYIERLEYENKLLKTKLRELLNLGKK